MHWTSPTAGLIHPPDTPPTIFSTPYRAIPTTKHPNVFVNFFWWYFTLKIKETKRNVPNASVINTLENVAPGPGLRIAIFYSTGTSKLTAINTKRTPRKPPAI